MSGTASSIVVAAAIIERDGRWLHVTPESLDRADKWFEKWDRPGVLIGAMTPLSGIPSVLAPTVMTRRRSRWLIWTGPRFSRTSAI